MKPRDEVLKGLQKAFREQHRIQRHHRVQEQPPTTEVLRGKLPEIEARENKDLPTSPSIAVFANSGAMEGGHAAVFIAVFDRRPNAAPNAMRYWRTHLIGDEFKPAKIETEPATSWADPSRSKTWKISQVRAENAIAVALKFTRVTSYWTGRTSGVISQREWFQMKDYHEAVDETGRQYRARDVVYKYGKVGTFTESYNPIRYIRKQRREYLTCASYAEIIIRAAGVEAPYSLGIQSGHNMVKYDKSIPHVFARLMGLAKEAPGALKDSATTAMNKSSGRR
jgi:hypothetical protein